MMVIAAAAAVVAAVAMRVLLECCDGEIMWRSCSGVSRSVAAVFSSLSLLTPGVWYVPQLEPRHAECF